MKIEYVTNYDDWCYLLINGEVVRQGHNNDFDHLIDDVVDYYNKLERKPDKMAFICTGFESGKDLDGVEMQAYVDRQEELARIDRDLHKMSAEMTKFIYDVYTMQPDSVTPPTINPRIKNILSEMGLIGVDNNTLTDKGISLAKFLVETTSDRGKNG